MEDWLWQQQLQFPIAVAYTEYTTPYAHMCIYMTSSETPLSYAWELLYDTAVHKRHRRQPTVNLEYRMPSVDVAVEDPKGVGIMYRLAHDTREGNAVKDTGRVFFPRYCSYTKDSSAQEQIG